METIAKKRRTRNTETKVVLESIKSDEILDGFQLARIAKAALHDIVCNGTTASATREIARLIEVSARLRWIALEEERQRFEAIEQYV